MLFIFCLLVFFYALLLFLAFCFLLFFCKFPVISLVHRERVLLHSCMAQRSQNSQISAGIWIKQGVWKLWDRGDVTPKIALFPRRIGSPLACLYSGQILLVSVVVELVSPGSLYDSVGSPPGDTATTMSKHITTGKSSDSTCLSFSGTFSPDLTSLLKASRRPFADHTHLPLPVPLSRARAPP